MEPVANRGGRSGLRHGAGIDRAHRVGRQADSRSTCLWIARRQALIASGERLSRAPCAWLASAFTRTSGMSITTRGMPGATTGTPTVPGPGGLPGGTPSAPIHVWPNGGPPPGPPARALPPPPRRPPLPLGPTPGSPTGGGSPGAGGAGSATEPAGEDSNSRRRTRGAASASMAVATVRNSATGVSADSPVAGLAASAVEESTRNRHRRSTRSPRSVMTHDMRSPISAAIRSA